MDAAALPVLDFFSTERTVEECLEALWAPSEGRARWIRLSSTIFQLIQADALQRVGQPGDRVLTSGFGAAGIHVRMLNDQARTAAFLEAIGKTVTPDDIVVDLGTGTGILAMAAARAGARHVYAIESSSMASAAAAVFARSQWSDQISLIRGWSTDVTLPEKGTVLISETLGLELFDEQMPLAIADATARLLIDGARYLPQTIVFAALPVSLSPRLHQSTRFTAECVEHWQALYGFDFRDLVQFTPPPGQRLHLTTGAAAALPALGPGVVIAGVDVASLSSSALDGTATVTVSASGRLEAVVTYFDVTLVPGVSFSTSPRRDSPATSWGNQVLLLEDPLVVSQGDVVRIRVYKSPAGLRAQATLAAAT